MNQTSCTVAGCTCNLADINWREPLCCYSVHEYEQPCRNDYVAAAKDFVRVTDQMEEEIRLLREAAQGVLDAWDADAMPEEDGFDPMVYNIDILRATIEKVKA